MPSAMKTKNNRSPRRRGVTVTKPQKTTAIKVTAAVAANTAATVTFDQVVILDGVPQYTTDVVGATPISAAQTSPTTVVVTFSASIAAATALNIPYEEPAIRNASGGFVSTSTFPV
jgi:hypothetical protein